MERESRTLSDYSANASVQQAAEQMSVMRNRLPLEAYRGVSGPAECPECKRWANPISISHSIHATDEGIRFDITVRYRCIGSFHGSDTNDFTVNYRYTPPATGGKLTKVS